MDQALQRVPRDQEMDVAVDVVEVQKVAAKVQVPKVAAAKAVVDTLLNEVIDLISDIKLDPVRRESCVVDIVEKSLRAKGINVDREVVVAKGSRVDLLTEDGVAIEMKKGKPNTRLVAKQIQRYAGSDKVRAIILVSERGLISHLNEANGKPVRYVALSHNWGLTI